MNTTFKALIAGCCMAAFATTAAQAAWWGEKYKPSPRESFPSERNEMNSNRNEDLGTRDYTRTRAPYPVGAPPVYNTYEEDRNANMAAANTRTSTDYRYSADKDVRSYQMNPPTGRDEYNTMAPAAGTGKPGYTNRPGYHSQPGR